jgi:phosphoserine phosphatase
VTSVSTDELLTRLTAARASVGAAPVLAFDADGTLWTGDVTRDLVSFIMAERPLLPDGLGRLRELAAEHGVPLASDIYDQLALLVIAYSAGKLESRIAVESVVTAFAGLEVTRFEELVAEAIGKAQLGLRFREHMRDVFAWARAEGLPVLVVTASPRLAVARALETVGLKADAVLGCEPAVSSGRLLPRLERPVLVDSVKVSALRAHTSAPVLSAFGDDVRDLPLLALAALPVLVPDLLVSCAPQ